MHYSSAIKKLIAREGLPCSFMFQVDKHYRLVAKRIASYYKNRNKRIVIAINGCQGSGKSTLARFLQHLLIHEHQLNTLVLSLDDLYLSLRQRQHLAEHIHPLFITRGVPGTHNIPMAGSVFNALLQGKPVNLPVFNKAKDDCVPKSDWRRVSRVMDIILFEGWCLGTPPQADKMLSVPVNALEASEDKDGIWRHYINDQLKHNYATLFSYIDYIIYLQVLLRTDKI